MIKKKKILGKRIIIENMFSKMKQFRRLNYRYDSKILSFIGFIYLAFFIILKNYMK
jgi:transposase